MATAAMAEVMEEGDGVAIRCRTWAALLDLSTGPPRRSRILKRTSMLRTNV